MRIALGATLFALLAAVCSSAQMRGGVVPVFGPGSGTTISFTPRGAQHPFRNNFIPGGFFPDGWYGDYYQPLAPQPTVVVVQPATPAPSFHDEARRSGEPLMIEWQGDRYVRYTSSQIGANAQTAQLDYAAPTGAGATQPSGSSSRATKGTANSPGAESSESSDRAQPLAGLVFRDGHQQDVGNYTIINRVMYVEHDYWSSGAWQQKIEMADLDIAATLKLNHDRGVKFILPTMPNEVVTRP